MKPFFALFTFLFIFSGSFSQNIEPLKILFVGNSFTHMNRMPVIFDKIAKKAGKKVLVEYNTKAGGNFELHSNRNDLYKSISKRKWDYVILQGYSQELMFDSTEINANTLPFVERIIDSIYVNNSCTNILLYNTWGYDEGLDGDDSYGTFDKMNDSIAQGYQYLSNKLNLPVVPVGQVWRSIRNTTSINLYAKDRIHPNRTGSFLVATTFFNAMFGEGTNNIYTSTVNEQDAKIIRFACQSYVQNNKKTYGLDRNIFEIQLDPKSVKKNEFYFLANFDNTIDYKWYFGDGSVNSSKNASHKYKKAGKYKVVLIAKSMCGYRHYEHEVIVEQIKSVSKPKRRRPKANLVNEKKI